MDGGEAPLDGAAGGLRGWWRPGGAATLGMLILLAIAGFFRFRHLGYSEFQGDEARAVLMAHQLTRSGSPEVLLMHKKGPIEVLLPAAPIRRGELGEQSARLPFAVAGLLGVLMAYALGARLWGPRTGWLAAMLLAIDGYLIAFSRIVQYQSVVFLFSVLAVWCAWRFYRGGPDAGRQLGLAGLFLGLGTWAHYEMVFALPPVAWLVFARGRAERWPARAWLRQTLPPALLMAAITALFYLPFLRHPQFAATSAYILDSRIGTPPFNQWGDYFQRASFYNASYYVLFMAAALVAVIVARLRGVWGRAGLALAGLWLLALALLAARPAWFALGPADAEPRRSLALLVFLPVLLALILAPRTGVRWRTLLLWFAGPFLAAGFLVQKPHTHFYTLMPAWALMVAWGLDRGLAALEARRADPRPARLAAGLAGALLLAIFALHQYVVFIRHSPEYKRVYPEARLPGYWTPFGDTPPRGGYFGFPYRAGWNTLRGLVEAGIVSGDYDSNEELLITGWYSAGAPRCGGEPRYTFVAWRPQDEEEIPVEAVAREQRLVAVIHVEGQPKLWIYDRAPDEGAAAPAQPLMLDDDPAALEALLSTLPEASDTAPGSSAGLTPPGRSIPVAQALVLALPERPMAATFEEGIRLLGADFPLASEAAGALVGAAEDAGGTGSSGGTGGDAGEADATDPGAVPRVALPPGATLGVTFAWEADARPPRNYSVFLHLRDTAGNTLAQADGWPACGLAPTSEWRPGVPVYDGHALRLPPDLAPGTYEVRAGLYDPETGARLAIVPTGPENGVPGTGAAGSPGGDGAGEDLLLWRFELAGAP